LPKNIALILPKFYLPKYLFAEILFAEIFICGIAANAIWVVTNELFNNTGTDVMIFKYFRRKI
jgi:hypothetical protein